MNFQKMMLLLMIFIIQSCESTIIMKEDSKKTNSGGSGVIPPDPNTTQGTFALMAVPPQEVILATNMSDIQITPKTSTAVSGCIFSGDKINGIIFDEDSCRISGKPLEIKTNSTIYVQAYNSEEISTILPIKITSYTTEDGIIADQKIFTTLTGSVSKVIATKGTCTLENPANLNGLSFNASTCTLTGTPSQLTAGKQLKFKITHAGGSFDYRYIDLVVDEKFTYSGKQYSKLDLVMKVDLSESLDRSFYLPIKPGFNYDFTIDWGDGQLDYINTFYNEKLYHIYESDVENPIIVISGKMPGIGGTPGIYNSILPSVSEIINFGDLKYRDLSFMFSGNTYAKEFYPNKLNRFTDLSEVRSILSFFENASIEIVNLSNVNFINLSSADGAFGNNLHLQTANFSGASFPNLKFMRRMFTNNSAMTTLNLTGATFPNLVSLEGTFTGGAFSSIDLTGFNFSKVTNLDNTFDGCINLTTLNLTAKDFSNVTSMNQTFANTSSLVSLDLSNKNLAKVLSANGLFMNTGLQTLNLINTSFTNVTRISDFYAGATNLGTYPLSIFDLSKIESMQGIFGNLAITTIDFSNKNLSKLRTLDGLLSANVEHLNFSGANLSGISTLTGLGYSNTLQTVNFSGANLSGVRSMSNFLSYNNVLISIDFSNIDLSAVTSSNLMFSYNSMLTNVNFSNTIMPSDLGWLFLGYNDALSALQCPVGWSSGQSLGWASVNCQ